MSFGSYLFVEERNRRIVKKDKRTAAEARVKFNLTYLFLMELIIPLKLVERRN